LKEDFKYNFFSVNDISFSPNLYQPYMATCSDDTLINLIDVEKGTLIRNFIGHNSYV
jgi:WD40 repeat protein